jgi:hypothetical protein
VIRLFFKVLFRRIPSKGKRRSRRERRASFRRREKRMESDAET